MPESFEQHFAQTPKKSPEQIKEEKALKLAEEIKKIEERMKKEGETPEGYQRMTELLRQIQEMYEEKREFVSERAKEIYQSLKNTPLWDKEKKQWNAGMDKEGKLESSDRSSENQLLGVLAEAVVGNLKEAKEIYQSLKNTPLWDKEKKQWNWYMDEKENLKDFDRASENQLLGVLAEAVVGNLKEAKEIYQSLKNTTLWDKEKKQWNWWMDEEGELKSSDRYSGNQLLGVLAEAVVGNLEEAKEIYQSLKNTTLWDKEKKQWNGVMVKNGELKDSDRYSKNQLLGVLAEAVVGNLEEAKEIYQSLKNTPLWDKEKKQWNGVMVKNGELKDSDRYSKNQLLGVLAEAVDEKGEEFIKFLIKENK
jgi:phosphoribosyl-AMP cyclohydrolase